MCPYAETLSVFSISDHLTLIPGLVLSSCIVDPEAWCFFAWKVFFLLPHSIWPVFTINFPLGLILIASSWKSLALQLLILGPLLGVPVATSFPCIAAVAGCCLCLFPPCHSLETRTSQRCSPCGRVRACALNVYASAKDSCSVNANCLLEWIHVLSVHHNHTGGCGMRNEGCDLFSFDPTFDPHLKMVKSFTYIKQAML